MNTLISIKEGGAFFNLKEKKCRPTCAEGRPHDFIVQQSCMCGLSPLLSAALQLHCNIWLAKDQ